MQLSALKQRLLHTVPFVSYATMSISYVTTDNFHGTFDHDFRHAKQLITFSGRDHLELTLLTGFIKGVHSFQANRQKGP